MTTDQAKEILALHRPGIDDPNEAEVAAALAMAQSDPALGSWFEQQCAVHTRTRQKFKEIEVPAELQELIITGRKRRSSLWWQSPMAWAAAAAIIFCVVIFSQRRRENPTFEAYRSRMVRTAMGNYPMPFLTNDLAAIRSYLITNNAHGDYLLPPSLAKLPGMGCLILSFHTRPVSLICFDGGQGKDVFLFVINGAGLANPPPAQRQIIRQGNLATASWSDRDKTYILATKGDEEFLRSLL
jgi:hypothetical protein